MGVSRRFHESGREFIAGVLAGSGRRIDGMYVEWTSGDGTPPTAADCTDPLEHFGALARSGKAGFVRVHVSNSYVDGATAKFGALLSKEDLPGGACDVRLTGVTLVSLGVSSVDDILVFSSGFERPVKVVEGAYTSVHASISLGAAK